jgi:hypothetical protein
MAFVALAGSGIGTYERENPFCSARRIIWIRGLFLAVCGT